MTFGRLHVVAGILFDQTGAVLIAQRPAGKALAGRWEFPGGKVRQTESAHDALAREIKEELGVVVTAVRPFMMVSHQYAEPRLHVRIDAWTVSEWVGPVQALDGQDLRWCHRSELASTDILEADWPIVTALLLPRAWLAARNESKLTLQAHGWHMDTQALGAQAQHVSYEEREILIDPADAASREGLSVYTSVSRFQPSLERSMPAGCIVWTLEQAMAVTGAGADFLLVAAVDLNSDELLAISALNVPWYLNDLVAYAADIRPTGPLSW